MRTTITLQDDAFSVATAYAKARALKLGDAVSELIRRGSVAPGGNAAALKLVDGLWVFDVPANSAKATLARKVTAAYVAELLDESK